MPNHRRWRGLLIGACVILATMGAAGTRAQTAVRAYLSPPEISEFPRLSAYLDVIDAQGNFVTSLTSREVSVLEDGLALPLAELQILQPGVQLVVAITPGAALGIRDAEGHTRYRHLMEGMLGGVWNEQAAGQDDFSLLTSDGVALIHSPDPAELGELLESYQPPEQGIPTLEVLAQALEVAADPQSRPGMERAVLFITPPQVADVSAGLQTLAARANQQNIHVFVWLIASSEYLSLPGATQLAALAQQTGGSLLAFTGVEGVPDLEVMLEPLRPVYKLAYDSRVATGGPHQVMVQVNLPEGELASPPQSFEINLQPPDPILVAPPVVIARSFAPAATTSEPAAAELIPADQALTLAVNFPDGYERPLVHSTLIIDGMLVGENTTPPFEAFQWDLRGYTQDGIHTLRVEVVDSLGLVGQSPEVNVQITVPRPEQGVMVAFERQRLLVIGLGVLIAGSVLALVLILGGRIRPQVGRPAARRRGATSKYRLDKDPVTQPVTIPTPSALAGQARPGLIPWLVRAPKQAQPAVAQPLGFLTPLAEAGAAQLPAPLPLSAEAITLGSDPQQASLVIHDPSVAGLHARMLPQEGSFHLEDAGSTAGTWVNYTQIPPEGVSLMHGDLVHLGRSGFRFTLREGGRRPKPTVQPLEPRA